MEQVQTQVKKPFPCVYCSHNMFLSSSWLEEVSGNDPEKKKKNTDALLYD